MILLYYSSKDRSLVIATFSVYSLISREVAGGGVGGGSGGGSCINLLQ